MDVHVDIRRGQRVLCVANLQTYTVFLFPYLLYLPFTSTSISPKLTHKQVKHDVSDDDVEGAEVCERGSEVAAVGLPVVIGGRAVGRRHHAVVHYLVPVLARHDTEQHRHAVDRRVEVRAPGEKIAGWV